MTKPSKPKKPTNPANETIGTDMEPHFPKGAYRRGKQRKEPN